MQRPGVVLQRFLRQLIGLGAPRGRTSGAEATQSEAKKKGADNGALLAFKPASGQVHAMRLICRAAHGMEQHLAAR